MKVFRKLALVSAIATLPATGFAMQAMDDAALSGVTGQDGISIGLGLDQTMNILIDDTELLLERDLSFNETQVLSKDAEEQLLYRDMTNDIAQQVVRHLAAVRQI